MISFITFVLMAMISSRLGPRPPSASVLLIASEPKHLLALFLPKLQVDSTAPQSAMTKIVFYQDFVSIVYPSYELRSAHNFDNSQLPSNFDILNTFRSSTLLAVPFVIHRETHFQDFSANFLRILVANQIRLFLQSNLANLELCE